MKLTTKLLKKIIKEELQKVNENESGTVYTVKGFKHEQLENEKPIIWVVYSDGEGEHEMPVFWTKDDADGHDLETLVEPVQDAVKDYEAEIKFADGAKDSLEVAVEQWPTDDSYDHYTDYY